MSRAWKSVAQPRRCSSLASADGSCEAVVSRSVACFSSSSPSTCNWRVSEGSDMGGLRNGRAALGFYGTSPKPFGMIREEAFMPGEVLHKVAHLVRQRWSLEGEL